MDWIASRFEAGTLRTSRTIAPESVGTAIAAMGSAVLQAGSPPSLLAPTSTAVASTAPRPTLSRPSGRPITLLRSDASGEVAAFAYAGETGAHTVFAGKAKGLHIDVKELMPILLWLTHYAPSIRGHILVLGTDNIGNVFNLNRLSARGPALRIITRIIDICDAYDIDHFALWIPRELNTLCDACSKTADYDLVCRLAGDAGISTVINCGLTTSV